MNRSRTVLLALSAAVLLGGAVTAYVRPWLDDGPPELPAAPASLPVKLVLAEPFTLGQPSVHSWRLEQPQFDSGYLLVLEVDRTLVHPRQAAEPVLYVGEQTAQRLNLGHESGFVVAVVPAPRAAAGGIALDLASVPIFFGAPDLPERIDAAAIAREVAAARAAGVAGAGAAAVAKAARPQLAFADDWELHLHAADLIEAYSPSEGDLVAGLRVPRVGPR